MKKYLLKSVFLLLAVIAVSSFSEIKAQSKITPTSVRWLVDGVPVSLTKGYKEGVKLCDKLTIELYFDKSILNSYSKDKMNFEFKWFYYYVTQKEFMDSYTVTYNESAVPSANAFSISSTRGNIRSGWWEVQVISKADGEVVGFQEVSRFQIYINK